MIGIIELFNKETLKSEVLCYVTEANTERYNKLNETLS